MKYMTLKQTKIIQGATAMEFQAELNAALMDVAKMGCKHELIFNNNAGLCAYVVYDEWKQIPETLKDEYELKGEEFRCCECPMYKASEDKRIKYTTCKHGVRRCTANDYACDWFYKELERGGIVPND